MVSVTTPFRPLDPITLFERATGERFLWERPSERFSMLGIGTATRITVAEPGRFRQAGTRWRELRQRTVTDAVAPCPLPTPVAFGGFSFDPDRRPDSCWQSFPAGLLLVPRLLFVSSQGSSWLTVNAKVTQDSGLEEIVAETELGPALAEAEAPSRAHESWGKAQVADELTPSRWRATVREVLHKIEEGAIEKLVVARRVSARFQHRVEPATVLQRLREGYPQCTLFAYAQGDACFLGATPERLVRLDGRTVRADVLAGSAPRGATIEEDRRLGDALLTEEKERREHRLVVQAVREALEPVCSSLNVPNWPELLHMPNVQHLHTPIRGTLVGGANVLELAERLHPTPAAGGLPRHAALSLIRRYEPFDRGWYAGPLGWIDGQGNGEFAVAIRSALIRGREAHLYAGCGIVAGSDPEREYAESCLKLRPMLWALNGVLT